MVLRLYVIVYKEGKERRIAKRSVHVPSLNRTVLRISKIIDLGQYAKKPNTNMASV